MEAWLNLIIGLGGVAGGILGKALVDLLRARADIRSRDRKEVADQQARSRKDAIDEWRDLAGRLQDQAGRHEAAAQQQQKALEALHAMHADCREETAELRGCLHVLLEALRRCRQSLSDLGHDPGPMPDLPPHRERSGADADYLVRQAAHSVGLASEAGQTVQPLPGGTP